MFLSRYRLGLHILVCIVSLGFATATIAKQPVPIPLKNLDFEQGKPGEVPPGWTISQAHSDSGYSVQTVEDEPNEGKRSALLTHQGELTRPFQNGSFSRSLDAEPYRGKKIRFSAAVRVGAATPMQAHLWFRVDRENGARGFFDNMAERPISSSEWKRYEIIGEVAPDAAKISLGLLLFRSGQAWMDSASVEVVGEAGEGIEPARRINDRGLENLKAFARLFGYLRYFHPSDEAAEADWNAIALAGVNAVEDAASGTELAQRLEAFFQPIAPSLRVVPTGSERPKIKVPANASELGSVAWHHQGLEIRKANTYRSRRLNSSDELPEDIEKLGNLPKPTEPLFTDLGGGVSALVPLALWADETGTLPRGEGEMEAAADKPGFFLPHGDDRTSRLAGVILAWNVFQHFYPYFGVVPTDWPALLGPTLQTAALDEDQLAFHQTLRKLVVQLQDGHGRATLSSHRPSARLPLLWRWVEGQLVILNTLEEETDLTPGDTVLSLDGEPVKRFIERERSLISAATPQHADHQLMRNTVRGMPGEVLKLKVRSPQGEVRQVQLQYSPGAPLEEKRPEKIAELEDGIFYVDLDRITDDDFKGALDRLSKARGILFDLRGYPRNVSPIVLSHLTDETIRSARWHIPLVTRPNREGMDFLFADWPVEPLKPRLKGKIAFLTDGRAVSYAETYLGIVEHYKLAEIVGEPTAGTNGNINPFKLPGGYSIVWTGMKVLKHDGSQHHGIGIQPTVPVKPTIQGIVEGRDEVLERALEVVKQPTAE